jgi:hypothetical protein
MIQANIWLKETVFAGRLILAGLAFTAPRFKAGLFTALLATLSFTVLLFMTCH